MTKYLLLLALTFVLVACDGTGGRRPTVDQYRFVVGEAVRLSDPSGGPGFAATGQPPSDAVNKSRAIGVAPQLKSLIDTHVATDAITSSQADKLQEVVDLLESGDMSAAHDKAVALREAATK